MTNKVVPTFSFSQTSKELPVEVFRNDGRSQLTVVARFYGQQGITQRKRLEIARSFARFFCDTRNEYEHTVRR